MSRSSSSSVVRRALNRVLPKPPILSRRAAALIGWRGPVAPDDDDIPPPEAFPRLIPQHVRPAEYLISQLARPDVGKDGHIQRSPRT
jgi:hypothetical protein